jgi:hypothetical protein
MADLSQQQCYFPLVSQTVVVNPTTLLSGTEVSLLGGVLYRVVHFNVSAGILVGLNYRPSVGSGGDTTISMALAIGKPVTVMFGTTPGVFKVYLRGGNAASTVYFTPLIPVP